MEEQTNMCLCDKSSELPTIPDSAHPPVTTSTGPSIDNHRCQPKLEMSRLDALDHADVLPNQSELRSVFDAAARLLTREDHTRQTLALKISRAAVRTLIAAHRVQAHTTEREHIESLHLDHAWQLQRSLTKSPSPGETSSSGDA